MDDLPEWKTRLEKIDVQLLKSDWDIRDKFKIRIEIDTKQSVFANKIYKDVSETLKNEDESKYVDYLLLDSNGDPLAIIEAKRTTKDPIIGQMQAEQYALDIKKQTGKDVFIYLSNGYQNIFWNYPHESPRKVMGFHSLEDLERMRFQNSAKEDLLNIKIKEEITNRPYQIEAIKRVLENVERGKRKSLLVMATGCGKTRTAMSLVDVLLRGKKAQRILFLADRKALRDQAFDAFKEHIPHESKSKIYAGELDKNSKIHVSTIQTFMSHFQDFSIGAFDIIVADECHRSIYNKWKEVFTYFDAIQIGLTATPSDWIDRDTFRFFECEDGKPTALYLYDKAVEENYLCDYRVKGVQTHFQMEGVGKGDLPDSVKKKLLEGGLDEEELNWEGTDIEKKIAVLGTNEVIVKEFMENCLLDESGTLPAKTIIFAVSKKHAKRIWEAFEKLYPEYKGRLARVITSEDSRADDLLKEFKKESFPRIAISVDMLDTGVDVPEVCNLIFAKPVFSKIKFWQMVGRGTRHNSVCKKKSWLPYGKKEHFLIFDFWRNFEYFDLNPKGKEASVTEAVTTRILKVRIELVKHFEKHKDVAKMQENQDKILESVNSLPKDSVSVKENLHHLEQVNQSNFWNGVGLQYSEYLKKHIMPLMRYQQDVNPIIASFVLKCDELKLALAKGDEKQFGRAKEKITEWLRCLPITLQQVKDKKELLNKILTEEYWNELTYEDISELEREFSELMPYKRKEPRPMIVLDIDDVVQQRKLIEFSPDGKEEYVDVYKQQVESKVYELANSDPTVMKIKEGTPIYGSDIEKLEDHLNSADLYINEKNLQKIYDQKGTLTEFLKHILNVKKLKSPEEKIDEEFRSFIARHNEVYSANQINFLRTLQTVFVKKKHIDYGDFFEAPFTNFGVNAPVPLFEESELNELVQLCEKLEHEVFAEA